MGDRIGQQFGNYRLTQRLGRGGFAEVYLGEHVHIQTQAAIKILSTQMAATDLERFVREAKTIASLEHAHIVRVFDFGIQDDVPFLVMGYAPNGTLRHKYPRESRVPLEDVASYVEQVAEALQYAHDRKIVHRDVKPENMLLGNKGEVLLSDFGIAVTTTTSTSRETKATAGTVAYMAPEQVMGKAVPASDQYALGITVYEWLAGKQPFQGSFFEVCAQHLHAPVPSLREANPDISVQVEQCILRALEKEPEKRFTNIQGFADALKEAAQLTIASLTYMPTEVTNSADVAEYTPTQHLSPEQLPDFQTGQSGSQTYNTPRESVAMPPQAQTNPSQISPTLASSASSFSNTPPPDLAPTRGNSASMLSMNPSNSNAGITGTGPHNTQPVMYGVTEPPFIPPAQFPPTSFQPSGAQPIYPASEPRRRSNKLPLILVCVLLAVLLITGSVLAAPTIGKMLAIKPNPAPTPISTVVGRQQATPTQKNAHKSGQTTAKQSTSTPTPTQASQQAVVRTISSTKSAYNTVNATGQQTTQATQATGSIIFNSRDGSTLQLAAGSTLTNVDGCTNTSLEVQLDTAVNLPANGNATVAIHVVQAGASGNIKDCGSNYAFYYCSPTISKCASNLAWNAYDTNGGFSGGADAQTYTAVSQYDVDQASAPLKQSTQQYAISDIQQQVQSNEHLEGNPQCTSTVTSNPAVGAKATQVTVTVSSTCSQQAST